MQFENSLGKLQYSSVTAPRKIIDMDVVPNSDPQNPAVQQKDTKKTRQLLLEIERVIVFFFFIYIEYHECKDFMSLNFFLCSCTYYC